MIRDADGKERTVQRLRDNLKCLAAMEDDSAAYLILGVENQAEVHYAIPVKNLVYDALQYAAQVEEIAGEHRKAWKSGKEKKPDSREFAEFAFTGKYDRRRTGTVYHKLTGSHVIH